MGYRLLSSVVVSPYLTQQIQKLANALSFDIVVTSGIRTAAAQVSAMKTKYDLAGGGESGRQELINTYTDDNFANQIADQFEAGRINQAIRIVQDYFDSGRGSSHGRGAGIDIRTTGGASGQLSEAQISTVQNTVRSFGWSYLREETPPHLHITVPNPPATEKKTVAFGGLIALGLVLWIFRK